MKFLFITLTVLFQMSAAQACNIPGSSPLKVTCTLEDGTERVLQMKSVYFDSEKGRAVGIGFGPNRQDDGLKVLAGKCVIEPIPQTQHYRAE